MIWKSLARLSCMVCFMIMAVKAQSSPVPWNDLAVLGTGTIVFAILALASEMEKK